MAGMKRYFIIVLCCLIIGILPVEAAKKEVVQSKKTQLEKREFQTRMFETKDKTLVMKALLNVLQDEGFMVNNANPLLGFISGTKEFDRKDKTIDTSKEFGTTGGVLYWSGVTVAMIEATANITEYGKQTRVRINFKRKLLNVYGNAQSISEIEDELYYQEFFVKVDKAIFIQNQKI